MATLHITYRDKKSVHPLPSQDGAHCVVGRAVDCDISLPEVVELSANHCIITCTPTGYTIEECPQTIGTYTGGRRITPREVMLLDVPYEVGTMKMVLVNEDPATAVSPVIPEGAPILQDTEEATQAMDETKPVEAAKTEPTPPAEDKDSKKDKPQKAKKSASPLKKSSKKVSAAELQNKAEALLRGNKRRQLDMIYIIVVLLAAFYAGISLYCWKNDGTPVPPIFR